MLAATRRERILNLARREGSVGIADLVAELGFSRVTIRRDLDVLSEQGMLQKVRGGAMLPTGPHQPAAPVDQVLIGMLIPSAYYFRHVVDGARTVTSERGGTVRLVTSGYEPSAEPQLVGELLRSGVDGLMLVPSFDLDESQPGWQDYLRTLAVPTVLIEREPPPTELATLSTVRSGHERGVAAALTHLKNLGHRRIALISRVFSQTGSFVQRGYRQAVADLGLDEDVPVIVGTDPATVRPGLTPEGPDIVLDQLVANRVTAVLCHGDEDALALSQCAQARNRAVPGELSIVSYNDEVAALGDPPLTAVAPPKERVGVVAARLLFDLLEPDSDRTPMHVQIDPRLIIRGSTAVPVDSSDDRMRGSVSHRYG